MITAHHNHHCRHHDHTQRSCDWLFLFLRYRTHNHDQSVVSDETRICYANGRSKATVESSGTIRLNQNRSEEIRESPSSSLNMMATVFWDRKGVLLVDFVEREKKLTLASTGKSAKLGRPIKNRCVGNSHSEWSSLRTTCVLARLPEQGENSRFSLRPS